MKSVLVFGAGRSGLAARKLLEREGFVVTVLDGEDVYPEGEYHFAVTSPGVPLTHAWQVTARERGVRVMSELELGATYWKGRTLAITGSKGKSSVVKVIADTLNANGREAVACGNYGKPLCEVVEDYAGRDVSQVWAVIEVSSFQMETTENFRPEAAAILNLQEDHLDRHGDAATYHGLKKKLLALAKTSVEPDPKFDRIIFSSYFDNPILRPNGEIAAKMLSFAGLSDDEIRAGFLSFVPLRHRMEALQIKGDVKFIDDSKATSLAALAAGVRMASTGIDGKRIHLIAGGLAKGDNPDSVKFLLSKAVKKVYLIGCCAELFRASWESTVPCEMCGTLERAVSAARRNACGGDIVLLSPGTASFDQFKSYGERGDAFAAYVKKEDRI